MAMPHNVWSKKDLEARGARHHGAEHLQALHAMAAPDSVTGPSGEGRIDEFALPGCHLDDGADQDGTADRLDDGGDPGSVRSSPTMRKRSRLGIAR
jgi:hypothetical protein